MSEIQEGYRVYSIRYHLAKILGYLHWLFTCGARTMTKMTLSLCIKMENEK